MISTAATVRRRDRVPYRLFFALNSRLHGFESHDNIAEIQYVSVRARGPRLHDAELFAAAHVLWDASRRGYNYKR